MKKYLIHIILAVIIIILAVVIGFKYFNNQENTVVNNSVETATPEPTIEPTEAPHEHTYTEAITTEATCTTDGEKTFTCACGDTYTEPIIAMGHVFGEYIYNGDATYFADGTQTAQCKHCEATDTGTAYQSKLEYTYIYIEKTMYAQQTVNVRDMPCEDGEKIGSLSTNDEVWVIRQCNETGWYEINNADISGYVSDSYLGANQVQTEDNYVTPETDNPGNSNPGGSGGGANPGETTRPPMNGGDGGDLVTDGTLNP